MEHISRNLLIICCSSFRYFNTFINVNASCCFKCHSLSQHYARVKESRTRLTPPSSRRCSGSGALSTDSTSHKNDNSYPTYRPDQTGRRNHSEVVKGAPKSLLLFQRTYGDRAAFLTIGRHLHAFSRRPHGVLESM